MITNILHFDNAEIGENAKETKRMYGENEAKQAATLK